ncbi:4Fe-4S ferredoxin iron-sulfur binding domain protein [Hymenobacter roseosalivarius DSM 11622]|uniref:4Fe-4S ferredoxin iron-sulfur binding domain protein n=1 Tax=Hymenobacter roseosalivarius DSM 11622 TaxID=645990 RepID=A0A1W1W5E9_9BACT|nr:4Fe-4S dicluster domain-containing protein [Hymenobacter roseosalivarius]SMC00334.1 4Fe-4S ferredoxin iron-sulfur binding domain protein [Hymenobacter roseosalivarius DSM 11622]
MELTSDHSFALAQAPLPVTDATEKVTLAAVALGLLALLGATFDADAARARLSMYAALALISGGTLAWAWHKFGRSEAGVKQNNLWLRASTSRGAIAWVTGLVLTGFYVLLYWFSWTLENLIRTLDPFSQALRGKAADQWFLYGTFYTLAILLMGARALWKYRHSRYQLIRTVSVMFFQLGFAFLLPGVLLFFQQPEFYFSYFWPLKYDYLFPGGVTDLVKNGGLGVFMVFWGAIMSLVATPVLTYFFGKRWYCSWVCGCGGLAETAGDPYRHLSDKSRAAWRWEVRIVYSVLALIVLITSILWVNQVYGSFLGEIGNSLNRFYGFAIGAVFSGVVGVGFYPIMGSRVWCRFGCPMAAYLGLLQKHFSRFRITTNGGQCISCGNCSNVCEMGIDVKQYAQRGEPIIRASCVGCGMCSTACPRGVLNLENGPREGRYQGSQLVHADSLRILS